MLVSRLMVHAAVTCLGPHMPVYVPEDVLTRTVSAQQTHVNNYMYSADTTQYTARP